jgi:hypothetical protein
MMKSTKATIVLPPPTVNANNQLAPFLKPKDIAEKGTTKLTLLGAMRKSTGRFGDGIDVACKIGKVEFTWTIKFESANYRILFERFGSNVANWKGVIKVERKEYLGNQYVAVVG